MTDCGCDERKIVPADAKPEVVSLDAAEHAFHTAGVRQGHGEMARQIADQLREAGKKYIAWLAEEVNDERRIDAINPAGQEIVTRVVAGYGSFAEQLEAEAGKASAEACQRIGQAIALKKMRGRSVLRRLRDALRAAVGGWRGGC